MKEYLQPTICPRPLPLPEQSHGHEMFLPIYSLSMLYWHWVNKGERNQFMVERNQNSPKDWPIPPASAHPLKNANPGTIQPPCPNKIAKWRWMVFLHLWGIKICQLQVPRNTTTTCAPKEPITCDRAKGRWHEHSTPYLVDLLYLSLSSGPPRSFWCRIGVHYIFRLTII